MHLFVRRVVLRTGAAANLHGDAATDPVHAQPRPVPRSITAKGRAAVDPDGLRLTVAAKQNFILSNMGVLTIVYGPTGMGLFTLSPDATASLERLAMVEKALLDCQAALIQRRQALMSAKEQPKE